MTDLCLESLLIGLDGINGLITIDRHQVTLNFVYVYVS